MPSVQARLSGRLSARTISIIHFWLITVVPETTYSPVLKTFLTARIQWHRHCFHCTTTSDENKRSQNNPTECPQRLGRVFRLARPSLGISRSLPNVIASRVQRIASRREEQHSVTPNQPNAHKGSRALFRLGAPSLGIFKTTRRPSKSELKESTAACGANRSPPSQPNAHKGSSALFRLGAPSLGIFYCALIPRRLRGQPPFEPEGCPNGLGGFSAFNPPKPGRLFGGWDLGTRGWSIVHLQ